MFKLTILVLLSFSDIAPANMTQTHSESVVHTNILHTSYEACMNDPSISRIKTELVQSGLDVTVKGICESYS